MFALSESQHFEPDPTKCSLSALIEENGALTWSLHLESQTGLLKKRRKADRVSFGLQCCPNLGNRSWTDLSGQRLHVSSQKAEARFYFYSAEDMFSDWDDLPSLSLEFGAAFGTEIELTAEGVGCVGGFPDHFPKGVVPFRIQTRISFAGVETHVLPGPDDPVAQARKRISAVLPSFSPSEPKTQRVMDDSGKLLCDMVLFPPLPVVVPGKSG